jgi:hypothetical protein
LLTTITLTVDEFIELLRCLNLETSTL